MVFTLYHKDMARKQIAIFTILFFVLTLLSSAQAQTTTATPEPTIRKNIVKDRIKEQMEEKKKEMQENLMKKKEEFRMVLQERMKVASESFAQRKEELRLRLQTIKDEKKKVLVTRINEKINKINKRRTDHMLKVLERLGRILDRLRQKVDIAKTNGKDVASVELAIDKAQTAVENARNAVGEQAPKAYQIDVTSEAVLRSSVGKVISGLQGDLRRVHALVIEAKQAVAKAVQLAARMGFNKKITITPTVTVTATVIPTEVLTPTVTATPTP